MTYAVFDFQANEGNEEFRSARLAAFVAKHAHTPAEELGLELERTLRNWAKQNLANDDVTFVVVGVA